LEKTWAGILWDSALSFSPFLEKRIAAARLAFKPLRGLAGEGLAPLSELREVLQAKVEGVLLYGAMFMFLAPDAVSKLTSLQQEFERELLGAPPWFSGARTRLSGGWLLSWGERLCLDVLVFRAEIWCCKSDMLVRQVWARAQQFPGRTFASVSHSLLRNLQLPEVYEFIGWDEFISESRPILQAYRDFVFAQLCQRSGQSWRQSLVKSCASCPHLLTQQFPCSAAKRLLDAGHLDILHDVDLWERFRQGLIPEFAKAATSADGACAYCGSAAGGGPGHILGSCPCFAAERAFFVLGLADSHRSGLDSAPDGDWCVVIFKAHADLAILRKSVCYCAQLVRSARLKQKQKQFANPPCYPLQEALVFLGCRFLCLSVA